MARHEYPGWQVLRSGSKGSLEQPRPTFEVLELTSLAFLAQLGSTLPCSLDEENTLGSAARCVVPFLCDCSFLYLEETSNSVRRIGAAHQDRWPDLTRSKRYSKRALGTCGPELVKRLRPDWFEAIAESPSEMRQFEKARFQSAMRLPLMVDGSYVGTLFLVSQNRTYRAEDFVLGIETSQRIASAIHNSRLYSAALHDARRFPQVGLAVLNHELRNLISPILGWARVFRNDRGVKRDPILSEGAESLERNARHMAKLVNDCLDLSYSATGRLQMDRTFIDLNGVIASASDAVKDVLRERRQTLSCTLTPGPLWVLGDASRLQQVITNLLHNSAKYSEAGTVIKVLTKRAGDRVEVEVKDQGQGISGEDLPKIFEPFYRGTETEYGGLGLGLAISRQIVSLHDGSIWAESAGSGSGCTMHLTLPWKERDPHFSALSSREPKRAGSCRVLLVEDSADVRVFTKLQLESLGHTVETVSNVRDAIRSARSHPPDLIVSDIRLAGLDGFSLARLLRSEPETAAIPLLAVTGMSGGASAEEARLAGFKACLLKPVEDEDLEHWIEQLTGRRQA